MKSINYFTKEKRYNTLSNYYKTKYGQKVFKIPLNGGFSCPNIDGTVAVGGCSFCSYLGSGDFAGKKTDSLAIQFEQGKKMMLDKWPEGLYIAYFQANTNTHAPVERLKELFEEAIKLDEKIVMISIATRADCLGDDVIEYLALLNTKMPVQVELGLQSIHEKTAKLVNRGHDLAVFDDAVRRLRKKGIDVVVHIINGLPNETKDMMVQTIKHLNNLDIQGVKIHMLHIMQKTKMGYEYLYKPWELLTRDEYVDIVVEQIRNLNQDIIVHRITGESPAKMLIAPTWTKQKLIVFNEVDKLLKKLNAYQGDKL